MRATLSTVPQVSCWSGWLNVNIPPASVRKARQNTDISSKPRVRIWLRDLVLAGAYCFGIHHALRLYDEDWEKCAMGKG
ncbi:hypothetical protein CERSUDRAFT_111379 [Gelatoporia subvermispora B]|uniref:Uncharacterized protein n=1 Tax=Ceriporiopsis subvermispora (strain B) TaxID=914234 RepID=M2R8Q3_CERS8|nr:hypothetical protein CERSUDRAFT_111379 [Gelatoporia subvermispora B]